MPRKYKPSRQTRSVRSFDAAYRGRITGASIIVLFQVPQCVHHFFSKWWKGKAASQFLWKLKQSSWKTIVDLASLGFALTIKDLREIVHSYSTVQINWITLKLFDFFNKSYIRTMFLHFSDTFGYIVICLIWSHMLMMSSSILRFCDVTIGYFYRIQEICRILPVILRMPWICG